MKNLIIAKRYAKALFNLAQEDGKVDQYGQELDGFVRLLGELPDLANAIQNPLYTEAARKAVFHSIAEKVGLSPILTSFINLLIEKKRVQNLAEIAEFYHRLIDAHANIARAADQGGDRARRGCCARDCPDSGKDDRQTGGGRVSAGPQLDWRHCREDWRRRFRWER